MKRKKPREELTIVRHNYRAWWMQFHVRYLCLRITDGNIELFYEDYF